MSVLAAERSSQPLPLEGGSKFLSVSENFGGKGPARHRPSPKLSSRYRANPAFPTLPQGGGGGGGESYVPLAISLDHQSVRIDPLEAPPPSLPPSIGGRAGPASPRIPPPIRFEALCPDGEMASLLVAVWIDMMLDLLPTCQLNRGLPGLALGCGNLTCGLVENSIERCRIAARDLHMG